MSKPVGEYQVRVVGTKVLEDNAGKNRIVIELTHEDGDKDESVLHLSSAATPYSRRKLGELGYTGSLASLRHNTTPLNGKLFTLRVKERADKNNPGKIYIDRELLAQSVLKTISDERLADLEWGDEPMPWAST